MTGFAEVSTVLGQISLGILAVMILAHIQKDLRRVVTGRNVVLGSIMVWYLFEAVTITNANDGEVVGLTQNEYDYGIFLRDAISNLFSDRVRVSQSQSIRRLWHSINGD